MSQDYNIYSPDWIFSYSQLNSFHNCKYNFYLTYLKGFRGGQNAFSLWGSFLHEINEFYYKGIINKDDLIKYYQDNYEEKVNIDFPCSKFCDMNKLYYENGYDYVCFLRDVGIDDNVSDCEHAVSGELELSDGTKKKFKGIIDRVAFDDSGDLILSDYKSKKELKKKEQEEYFRQLYVYAYFYHEETGIYPKNLRFIFMRAKDNKKRYLTREFKVEDMNKAIKWCTDTIEEILSCNEWDKNENDFFCQHLCGQLPFDCNIKEKLFLSNN